MKNKNKLIPKKTKFIKIQKGTIKPITFKKKIQNLDQGFYALKVLKNCRLDTKQIEATRRKISKEVRKKEKLWLKILPDIAVTAKPNEIRMGKGKGSIDYWVFRLSAGRIIFELSYMSKLKSYAILAAAKNLLPIPTKIVKKQTYKLKKNENLKL